MRCGVHGRCGSDVQTSPRGATYCTPSANHVCDRGLNERYRRHGHVTTVFSASRQHQPPPCVRQQFKSLRETHTHTKHTLCGRTVSHGHLSLRFRFSNWLRQITQTAHRYAVESRVYCNVSLILSFSSYLSFVRRSCQLCVTAHLY